jgi:hypothetical protein
MTQKRLALTLLVLVVAAAAVLVWLVRDSGGDVVGAGVTTAESADARVVSSAVKEDVREVAAEAATAAYSYSWETLAEDKAAARDHMTEAMQDRYDRTMAGVATTSRRDRTVVSAEVVDTALVTASPTYARVLVFVNQSTSGDDLDEPRLDLDRVLVSLQRVGGRWRLSELDAL